MDGGRKGRSKTVGSDVIYLHDFSRYGGKCPQKKKKTTKKQEKKKKLNVASDWY